MRILFVEMESTNAKKIVFRKNVTALEKPVKRNEKYFLNEKELKDIQMSVKKWEKWWIEEKR